MLSVVGRSWACLRRWSASLSRTPGLPLAVFRCILWGLSWSLLFLIFGLSRILGVCSAGSAIVTRLSFALVLGSVVVTTRFAFLLLRTLSVSLNLTGADRRLVAHILPVKLSLAELDLKDSHRLCELQVVEAFLERLILIEDGRVTYLVNLVQACNPMLHELSELHSGFNSAADSLDRDKVDSGVREKVVSTLQVPSDTDFALDSDLVGRKFLLGLVYLSVLVSHVSDCLIQIY